MTFQTRREFLERSSVLAAGLTVYGARPILASTLGVGETPAALLEDPMDPAMLRSLATQAIEAARAAGASYADVRIGTRQSLGLRMQAALTTPSLTISSSLSYGVRVLVDGTWGFVHGITPTSDAITRAARSAVGRAKGYSQVTHTRVTLAPAPVATGEWTSTAEIHPFSVPVGDQADLMGAFNSAMVRVIGVSDRYSFTSLSWDKNVKVFASSEGSLTTQTMTTLSPRVHVSPGLGARMVRSLTPVNAGYEHLLKPGWEEEIKQFAEETVRLVRIPRAPVEPGRLPAVLDGSTMAFLAGAVITSGLEMDRVLRHEADSVGTSYLAPPATSLDTPIASPLLTLTADRAMPHLGASRWDDEGVVPENVTLIQAGVLKDYLTTRSTAPELAEWYAKQGREIKSHGCASVVDYNRMPMPVATHAKVAPATQRASLEDLIKGVKHGILVIDGQAWPDQNLSGGQLHGLVYSIEQGQIKNMLFGATILFRSDRLWKSLTALGDSSTVVARQVASQKGQPPQVHNRMIDAPAGLFSQLDITPMRAIR